MLSEKLISFHDKVFVLTLRGSVERQENVIRELGPDRYEFFYGIDGKTLTKEELIRDGTYDEGLARERDPHDRTMTVGHICCTLGHRMIYERMMAENIERALVFEDDIYSLPASEQVIEEIVDDIPENAEFVYWGYIGGKRKPFLGGLQQAVFHVKHALGSYKQSHRAIRNIYMRPYNDHFDVASVNFLAHAYTVTRSAAETLIKRNTPITVPADHVIVHAALEGEIRAYASLIKLFGQRSTNADDPMESLTLRYSDR